MNRTAVCRLLLSLCLLLAFSVTLEAKDKKKDKKEDKKQITFVVMETTMGDVEFRLYNETPKHKKNFIKLVEEHFYDSLLFHRVINKFVVQCGDPDSRNAEPGAVLGNGDVGYQIPAEFKVWKGIIHKKGALSAARDGDNVNPDRKSSGSQFFFVMGEVYDEIRLMDIQETLDRKTDGQAKLTPELKRIYKTIGGTPHLDGQYTVFGEVTSGLDVLENIQKVKTDEFDRPVEDVRIIKMYIKPVEEI